METLRAGRAQRAPVGLGRRWLAALLGGIVCWVIVGLAVGPPRAGAAVEGGAEWLFVQDAPRAELRPTKGERLVLTLVNPDQTVEAFTDRPARRSAVEPLADFLRSWDTYGFTRTPPNAAIVVEDGRKKRDVLIVELGEPRLDAQSGDLSYVVKPLQKPRSGTDLGRLARRADEKLPRRLGATSVFIDDADNAQVTVSLEVRTNGAYQAGFAVSGYNLSQVAMGGELNTMASLQTGSGGILLTTSAFSPSSNVAARMGANPTGACVLLTVENQSGAFTVLQANVGQLPPKALVLGVNKLPVSPTASC